MVLQDIKELQDTAAQQASLGVLVFRERLVPLDLQASKVQQVLEQPGYKVLLVSKEQLVSEGQQVGKGTPVVKALLASKATPELRE